MAIERIAIAKRMQDVKAEPVKWLWPGKIPIGKLSILCGMPGVGKSTVSLDIAARVSSGRSFFDCLDVENPAGGVVLIGGEDDLGDTVKPRLVAAKADCSRIVSLEAVGLRVRGGATQEKAFGIDEDLAALRSLIEDNAGTRLVIIDPISAFLGTTDSHKEAEVRGALAPLAALAADTDVAILMVAHPNKNENLEAMHRVSGSAALVAVARTAWMVNRDGNDNRLRVMRPLKSNLSDDSRGIGYTIEPTEDGMSTYISWQEGKIEMSNHKRTEIDEAASWLRDFLSNGPRTVKEIRDAAVEGEGLVWITIKRAKKLAGIKAQKSGMGGGWIWSLSEGYHHTESRYPSVNRESLRRVSDTLRRGSLLAEESHDSGGGSLTPLTLNQPSV